MSSKKKSSSSSSITPASSASAAASSSSSPSASSSSSNSVSSMYDRFCPPKWGLSVVTATDGRGSAEAAMTRLDRKGMDSGLMRDWTYKSPLAPGTCKYEKPTQRRQRIERKGAFDFKQKQLLTILRTVLFKKNRG